MKKVEKLVIYRSYDEDDVYGCPECNLEVDYEDSFCKECGVEFGEEK